MKHARTTALIVVEAHAGQPAGIITDADVARAIAEGKDVNDVRVDAVTTTRPAVTTTTTTISIGIWVPRCVYYLFCACGIRWLTKSAECILTQDVTGHGAG